jgi:hypothetical protein
MVKHTGFRIEKSVPIPPSRGGSAGLIPGRKQQKYPFIYMDVGDSFAAPRDMGRAPPPSYADRRQTAIKSQATRWCKDYAPDKEFITRIMDGSTVRCWRVK